MQYVRSHPAADYANEYLASKIVFGDWFNLPVIHKVERLGEVIRIQTSDDGGKCANNDFE